MWFFTPSFVTVMYHTDSHTGVDSPLRPWDESHLLMLCVHLIYCRVQFANSLLRLFASVLIEDITCNFLFL